ncbi:DUF3455 domain-containing protein [Winogradskya consettensis]|uniref:Tat pathway signal sequence domain protein n=1 Tax=Winogradskya consettensis TaxID=113560 RepID=A0A919SRT5_9ACTN|nr:DUF3455 domain-containing protein [Actinoplanes consettensis]GIM77180.1 hypothetical protein Aco04nite_54060 [Actinoplanes consettensis]
MSTKTVRISAAVGATALALAGITTGVSFAGETPAPQPAGKLSAADSFLGGPPSVPAALVPPPGNTLTAVFKAKGVQIYGCATGAWTLTEPAATLAGLNLKPVRPATALHFRGPSWESDEDGTLVEGKTPVSAPSDTPGSIPQLLVTAATTRGTGVFGGVTYIQRLGTVGGVAPATTCVPGDTTAVKYQAVYRFFKKS